MAMDETRKGFLLRLQELPEPAKRRAIVVATVVIMALIIYFWLAYFNNLITGIAQSGAPVGPDQYAAAAPAAGTPAGQGNEPAGAPGENVGQRIRDGMGFIYGEFVNLIRGFSGMWNAPGQYNVKPPQ